MAVETKLTDQEIASMMEIAHPTRREPNHYVTGRDGGHDIDLRAHALAGMQLHGRLMSAADGRLRFAGDLADAGIRSVVWATGFRSDWSWVQNPGFLREGYPRYTRGICDVNGLYVLGLPWLWTWGSGRFAGVARDAEHVADRIAARARVPAAA